MIKSMTGYGRREGTYSRGTLTVELRSVNHRFLEVVARLPRSLAPFEEELKRQIQRQAARGRFELTVLLGGEPEGEKRLTLNRPRAREYHAVLKQLQRELRLPGAVDLTLMAGFRDLFSATDTPAKPTALKQTVVRVLRSAMTDLDAMRRREGQTLKRDLDARLDVVQREVDSIAQRAPAVVEQYFARMKARVERLLAGEQPDAARLNQELAAFAERSDITEEVTRLRSHLEQFRVALDSRKPVGRTLDFLLQEMGREINTIGSKANDTEISARVVQVKGELEKIREQVQNVE